MQSNITPTADEYDYWPEIIDLWGQEYERELWKERFILLKNIIIHCIRQYQKNGLLNFFGKKENIGARNFKKI